MTTDNEQTTLSPCPLCGSTDLLLRDIAGWELDCRGCELSLVLADDPTREGLVARWNTRVSAASTAPVVGQSESRKWVYSKDVMDALSETFDSLKGQRLPVSEVGLAVYRRLASVPEFAAAAASPAAPADNELLKLRQAIGWICDAADAAYIEDSDNTRIHEIFNIAAQAAGITRRLPDEHQRFDETSIG